MISTAEIVGKEMSEFFNPDHEMKRVLLIKNMWIKGDAMHSSLEDTFGWTVTAVHRGEQAFELLKGGGYDLVITDVSMINDHYSGFRLIRAIRYDLDQTVPIMVVTNLASPEIKDAACCLGANEYMTLPFQMAQFLSAASKLVTGSDYVSDGSSDGASDGAGDGPF